MALFVRRCLASKGRQLLQNPVVVQFELHHYPKSRLHSLTAQTGHAPSLPNWPTARPPTSGTNARSRAILAFRFCLIEVYVDPATRALFAFSAAVTFVTS